MHFFDDTNLHLIKVCNGQCSCVFLLRISGYLILCNLATSNLESRENM